MGIDDLSQSELDKISVVDYIFSSLGFFISLIFILYYFVSVKNGKVHPNNNFLKIGIFKLFCVCCSSSFTALGRIATDDRLLCSIQTGLFQFYSFANFLWTFALGVQFIAFLRNDQFDLYYRFSVFFHALIWLFSFAITVIVICTDLIGDMGEWCWVNDSYPNIRAGMVVGPVLVSFSFLLISLITFFCFYSNQYTIPTLRFFILWILVFYLFSWGPFMINKIYTASSDTAANLALYSLSAALVPLEGVLLGGLVAYFIYQEGKNQCLPQFS